MVDRRRDGSSQAGAIDKSTSRESIDKIERRVIDEAGRMSSGSEKTKVAYQKAHEQVQKRYWDEDYKVKVSEKNLKGLKRELEIAIWDKETLKSLEECIEYEKGEVDKIDLERVTPLHSLSSRTDSNNDLEPQGKSMVPDVLKKSESRTASMSEELEVSRKGKDRAQELPDEKSEFEKQRDYVAMKRQEFENRSARLVEQKRTVEARIEVAEKKVQEAKDQHQELGASRDSAKDALETIRIEDVNPERVKEVYAEVLQLKKDIHQELNAYYQREARPANHQIDGKMQYLGEKLRLKERELNTLQRSAEPTLRVDVHETASVEIWDMQHQHYAIEKRSRECADFQEHNKLYLQETGVVEPPNNMSTNLYALRHWRMRIQEHNRLNEHMQVGVKTFDKEIIRDIASLHTMIADTEKWKRIYGGNSNNQYNELHQESKRLIEVANADLFRLQKMQEDLKVFEKALGDKGAELKGNIDVVNKKINDQLEKNNKNKSLEPNVYFPSYVRRDYQTDKQIYRSYFPNDCLVSAGRMVMHTLNINMEKYSKRYVAREVKLGYITGNARISTIPAVFKKVGLSVAYTYKESITFSELERVVQGNKEPVVVRIATDGGHFVVVDAIEHDAATGEKLLSIRDSMPPYTYKVSEENFLDRWSGHSVFPTEERAEPAADVAAKGSRLRNLIKRRMKSDS